jgi:hypothetical protein
VFLSDGKIKENVIDAEYEAKTKENDEIKQEEHEKPTK